MQYRQLNTNQLSVVKEGSTQSQKNTVAWLRLIRDHRWSNAQKRHLLARFKSPVIIYDQSYQDLCATLPRRWRSQKPTHAPDWLELELQWLEQPNHYLICLGDPEYPAMLSEISDPPLALFCEGDICLLQDPAVAIVGSRRPTPSGKSLTQTIASELASLGIVITSGMALGIDGAAHQGALQSNGATVAVMGCGMDTIYPARHQSLFHEIAQTGCLLSEYPLGTPVSKFTFPNRNRIVSGLAHGVLVVEAAQKSGTMITARLAMEQNRSVMALPGSPLSRQYCGSHQLLQQGATLVTCAGDILNELSLPLKHACVNNTAVDNDVNNQTRRTPHKLLSYIYHESTSVDQIISASRLTAAEVSSMLLMLEIENAVTRADDGGYVKLVS